jgi:hypothetical protein
MITGESVWLTDYRFLNDKKEFLHTIDLTQAVKAEFIEAAELNKPTRELLRFAGASDLRGKDAVIFSLSEHRDDLSQWRGYAREGSGFTIGFDTKKLLGLEAAEGEECSLLKVQYDSGRELQCLKQALDEIAEALEEAVVSDPDDVESLVGVAIEAYDYIILNRALNVKHKSFKSENEWRLVYYPDEDGANRLIRVRGSNLIPYVSVKYRVDSGESPIKEIGVGPGFSSDETKTAIEILLRQSKVKADVYFADSPFRQV